jgi:ParB family chromosome partitioning protein
MATARRPRTNPAATVPPNNRQTRTPVKDAVAMATSPTLGRNRLVLEYMDINDIVPYEWNPRQNAEAVASVAASMRLTGGFAMPVIIDANNVLIAGHTRIEAAKSLGLLEAPYVRLSHLTPEQVNAFRVIDNKVAENAKWDFDLLAGEISKLGDLGLNWTDFGWSQGEIDCLSEMVASDCLETESLNETAERETAGHQQRRAPTQVRFVLGEVSFFVQASHYRSWVDGVRSMHNFGEAEIVADLKNRLGILE